MLLRPPILTVGTVPAGVLAEWSLTQAADADTALAALEAVRPALVVVAPDVADAARLVHGVRALDAGVPVVAIAPVDGAGAAGVDAVLPPAARPEALAAALHAWLPADAPDPVRARLAAMFGAAELAALDRRFADQLLDAVRRMAEPDGAARAHRIAGLAGTLGFDEVYETWLPVSEDAADAAPRAAAAARRALQRIAFADVSAAGS